MIIKLLDAGLELDVYGSCALRPLSGSWIDLPKKLISYKFYFSFENSFHCRDYITEKVWSNALQAGLVPVIWGPTRSDVNRFLPEGSFIFVEDFPSVENLIERLRYYDKHDKEYKRFFDWRNVKSDGNGSNKRLMEVAPELTGYCSLCQLLHEDDIEEEKTGSRPRRQRLSMRDWWYGRENPECLSPQITSEWVSGLYQTLILILEVHCRVLTYKYHYTIAMIILTAFLLLQCSRQSFKFYRSFAAASILS